MRPPLLVTASTYHGRRGGPRNDFRYSADFVLLPLRSGVSDSVRLFSVNHANALAFYDTDHGDGDGPALAWAQRVLDTHGLLRVCDGEVWLLTQPRWLGFGFNPVSFWFCTDQAGAVRAVIAEVNNTFGDRHAYLCRHADARPIQSTDRITAEKVFHVSPFQGLGGRYCFRFLFEKERVGAWIDYRGEESGLYASVTGSPRPLTDLALAGVLARRPLGAARVLALIYWQAMKLKWKGARYRRRPAPPKEQVTL